MSKEKTLQERWGEWLQLHQEWQQLYDETQAEMLKEGVHPTEKEHEITQSVAAEVILPHIELAARQYALSQPEFLDGLQPEYVAYAVWLKARLDVVARL